MNKRTIIILFIIFISNLDEYETIFLGYPNWWGTFPMAVFTFLESYDLSNKTIIPFCTHEGSSFGRSLRDLKRIYPQVEILEGFSVRGSSVKDAQKDVEKWLKGLGFTN